VRDRQQPLVVFCAAFCNAMYYGILPFIVDTHFPIK
jgi:hypothetical protein